MAQQQQQLQQMEKEQQEREAVRAKSGSRGMQAVQSGQQPEQVRAGQDGGSGSGLDEQGKQQAGAAELALAAASPGSARAVAYLSREEVRVGSQVLSAAREALAYPSTSSSNGSGSVTDSHDGSTQQSSGGTAAGCSRGGSPAGEAAEQQQQQQQHGDMPPTQPVVMSPSTIVIPDTQSPLLTPGEGLPLPQQQPQPGDRPALAPAAVAAVERPNPSMPTSEPAAAAAEEGSHSPPATPSSEPGSSLEVLLSDFATPATAAKHRQKQDEQKQQPLAPVVAAAMPQGDSSPLSVGKGGAEQQQLLQQQSSPMELDSATPAKGLLPTQPIEAAQAPGQVKDHGWEEPAAVDAADGWWVHGGGQASQLPLFEEEGPPWAWFGDAGGSPGQDSEQQDDSCAGQAGDGSFSAARPGDPWPAPCRLLRYWRPPPAPRELAASVWDHGVLPVVTTQPHFGRPEHAPRRPTVFAGQTFRCRAGPRLWLRLWCWSALIVNRHTHVYNVSDLAPVTCPHSQDTHICHQ